jgi:hypothetical protein
MARRCSMAWQVKLHVDSCRWPAPWAPHYPLRLRASGTSSGPSPRVMGLEIFLTFVPQLPPFRGPAGAAVSSSRIRSSKRRSFRPLRTGNVAEQYQRLAWASQAECRGFDSHCPLQLSWRALVLKAALRKRAGAPGAVCHQSGLRVLTNDPGIDISAAPPELGSGRLHSHTTPTLPRSSDLADRLGPDRDLI